ncbi:MAG TPA: GC-type dockerin domain-anchored protein [Thermoanaerobaculia bacterium]|nr:GC-type dockerin domain-anchored protein [Thermoanaerobaculia bacterium]
MKLRLRFALLCLGLVIGLGAAVPEPAVAVKKQCYCVTPKRKNGKATGKDSKGRPSKFTIKWGNPPHSGFTVMVTPTAGQSATDIATALAAALAAQGLHPCPIMTKPSGQALVCVTEMAPNVGGTSSSSTDTAFNSMTWLTQSFPVSIAMQGVAGTFTASEVAAGGSYSISPTVVDGAGNEIMLTASAATVAGDPGDAATLALIDQLNDLGLVASSTVYDFADGTGEHPAIRVEPGIFVQLTGLGVTTEDLALTDLRAAQEMLVTDSTADLNGDGLVDGNDLRIFMTLMQGGKPAADMNRDGRVGQDDLAIFLNELRRLDKHEGGDPIEQ